MNRPLAITLALALAGPALAQDRAALVVANSGYAGDQALPDVRDTALEMSEALFGMGFDVTRLENPAPDALADAIARLQEASGPAVIYYAGHGFAHEGESYLQSVTASGGPAEVAAASVPVATLLAASGARETMVFLDTCHGPASQTVIGAGALDRSLAESATGIFNLLTVTSVQPGVACPEDAAAVPPLTGFLLERLGVPGLPSTEIVPEVAALPAFVPPTATEEELAAAAETPPPAPGVWAASTLNAPFIFRQPTSDQRLTAEDYRILESLSPAAQEQMIALWRQSGIPVDVAGSENAQLATSNVDVVADDGVVLVAPVQAATVVSSVSVASVARVDDGITIFNANPAPAPTLAARPVPGAGGLPRPSIIVGFPQEDVVEASFEAAPEDLGPIGGNELSYDNLEARRALKASDEALFASLVESGAFDPPTPLLATALQTELARMKCYTSTIDGIWGRGSRASVDRYYEEVGGSSPSQDPDVRIFRQIVLKDDVECPPPPAPVAAAPRRQTSTQSAPRRQTTQQAAPRRQAQPAPAPAPAPAPQRRTLSTTGGTGVFR